jgi:uncharacterized protein (TIGR00369 family)
MDLAIPYEQSFDATLGIEMTQANDQHVSAVVPVRPVLLQPYGLVHGGVLASVAESLASVGTALGVASDGKLAVGAQNDTTFLRSITHGTIHATAHRRHTGRTRWIWDVELRDDLDCLCALTRMSVAIRDPHRR